MAARKKTGFDKYFDERMRDAGFARAYTDARAEIDAIDRIIQALDEARQALGISKADLARMIGAKPEIVRRLFTAESPNPTIITLVKIAKALGLDLDLVPAGEAHAATDRGRRDLYSSPSLRTQE